MALVKGPLTAYRVAKESYGPLNPQERGSLGEDRSGWYRFDTPGRTLYASADPESAIIEALSWARMTHGHRTYLAKTARFMGLPVGQMRRIVEEEWSANSSMVPGRIPANWREGRLLYTLQFGAGRWIDIAHAATLTVLNDSIGRELHDDGVLPESLTLSEVTGGDRRSTTLLAAYLREQVLEDGTYPLGIRFPSKHGSAGAGQGHCYAFWMRRRDVGLDDDMVSVSHAGGIAVNHPADQTALTLHGIQS
ncbi:hypothetical protein ACFY5D_21515 [Paeniglutamicibacter sp. NPDC012692]|uniref:hypothetical protein n=1 Tax=Paeniglutamicibacter sp. NPDC012692 TaxID=3364388 RepID=UPI00368CAC68